MAHWVQSHLFDDDGPSLARDGMDRVLEPEREWVIACLRRFRAYLEQHREISADDAWQHNLWAWQPHDSNCIGAFWSHLRAQRLVGRPIRTQLSRRTSARGRRIVVYPSLIWRGQK